MHLHVSKPFTLSTSKGLSYVEGADSVVQRYLHVAVSKPFTLSYVEEAA